VTFQGSDLGYWAPTCQEQLSQSPEPVTKKTNTHRHTAFPMLDLANF